MSTPHADVENVDRLARVKLSSAIEPGDLRVTGLVSELGPVEVLDYFEAAGDNITDESRLGLALQGDLTNFDSVDVATGYLDLREWGGFADIVDAKPQESRETPTARVLVGMVMPSEAAAKLSALPEQVRPAAYGADLNSLEKSHGGEGPTGAAPADPVAAWHPEPGRAAGPAAVACPADVTRDARPPILANVRTAA